MEREMTLPELHSSVSSQLRSLLSGCAVAVPVLFPAGARDPL